MSRGADSRDPDVETARLRARLGDLVTDGGISVAALEARAGLRRGQLRALLAGTSAIKLVHVLAILEALGIAPGPFFADLYPGIRTRRVERIRVPSEDDVVSVYGFGIERLEQLCTRVQRCEVALSALARRGWFPKL